MSLLPSWDILPITTDRNPPHLPRGIVLSRRQYLPDIMPSTCIVFGRISFDSIAQFDCYNNWYPSFAFKVKLMVNESLT